MKIICSQYALNKALNTVQKAISNKTTIPVLKGILIETTDHNSIKLTTTDSEITIEKECECIIQEEGSLVVSAKLFSEMIRRLPDDDIIIEEKDGIITIKCKKYKSDIVALPAEEFPSVNREEAGSEISFNSEEFRSMIKKSSFAASTDDSRGVLTGVLIKIMENTLSMVAIDGFRVAITRTAAEAEDSMEIIISARILNEISKILAEEEEEKFTLCAAQKSAVFNIGNTRVTARLLEGNFLDYEEILPKDYKTSVTINRRELINVIERASLVAREGNNNNLIKVNIDEEESLLTVASRSEAGKITEDMSVEIEGNGIEIGFNSKYVLDVIKVIDDDAIRLELNSNITPCMIKPVEGSDFDYLILPVRL